MEDWVLDRRTVDGSYSIPTATGAGPLLICTLHVAPRYVSPNHAASYPVWSYRLAEASAIPQPQPRHSHPALGILHYPIGVNKASLQAYIGLNHVQGLV
jgi:hypothetical protein